MTHTDQIRHMIALVESAPTTEGVIDNSDFQVRKFIDLLNKWHGKIEGLQDAARSDGNWAQFLTARGKNLGELQDVEKSAAELAESLLQLMMSLDIPTED